MVSKSIHYNGNSNIKRSGVPISWSQDRLKEYNKCKRNPIYFAEKYIKIVDVDKGLIQIKLYKYQKQIIKNFMYSSRQTVVTSRQAGKTTTAAAILLHYVLFNEYKLVALLANKGDAAREILERIKIAFEALPDWLQQGVVEWNKGNVTLENGCKIIAAATSSSSIRGKSAAVIYIDETAFVDNWDTFSASVLPTISSGKNTKALFTSTPNGLNHFHRMCEAAKKGAEGQTFVEVPWNEVPGRGKKWKDQVLADLNYDQERFRQEYEIQFLGSSGTLIVGSMLEILKHEIPAYEADGLRIYDQEEKSHSYVCIVDVSRGKGLDYSAFQMIDVSQMPYKLVCSYNNNTISPVEYSEVIYRIGTKYNEASVLVEVNDIGAQISDLLHFEYEYEGILHTASAGRSGKRLTSVGGNNVDKGIRTTKTVKSIGCSMLKLLIEQNQLLVTDADTIEELSTFSKKGVSYEAEPGCHDDLVMCLVLFGWLTGQQEFSDITDINTISKLRERSEEELMEEVMPFLFSDAMPDENIIGEYHHSPGLWPNDSF